jgi:hypothetical protein
MTDYQSHVAEKAKQLISLMEDAAKTDAAMVKLLNAMRSDLELIAEGRELLPSDILSGWSWYFLWENPERIDKKYAKISNDEAELLWLTGHASMESYLKSKAFLESLSPRKPE